MANNRIIGLQRPNAGIGFAGVGYVVVPNGSRRQEYIEDCYRTQTLTIHGGWGYGYFPAVKCPPTVLQEINFPVGSDDENIGTSVVWIKDSVSQRPVIVAALGEDTYFELGERTHRVSKQDGKTSIDLFADAKNSNYQINILGRDGAPATLDIKVRSNDSAKNASAININCDHAVNISSDDEVNIVTTKKFDATVLKNGTEKANIHYDHDNGLEAYVENRISFTVEDENKAPQLTAVYSVIDREAEEANDEHGALKQATAGLIVQDQFLNELKIIEDGIHLKDKFENTLDIIEDGIHLKDKFEQEINITEGDIQIIGEQIRHNEGSESMVLGDTLASLLNELVTAIKAITVMTPVGVSSIPVNQANFVAIANKIDTIKSKISKVD